MIIRGAIIVIVIVTVVVIKYLDFHLNVITSNSILESSLVG